MRQTKSNLDERQNFTTGTKWYPFFLTNSMYKVSLLLSVSALILFTRTGYVSADYSVVSNSAQLQRNFKEGKETLEYRTQVLRGFLESHNSPLTPYAGDFVENADRYEIDWRIVAAISGVESTFGKRIPYNSYNAYGWANGKYKFNSWPESIEVVSKTLREKYYDKGAKDINSIARRYAPPSTTWAWKVKFFMDKIDGVPIGFDL